MISLRASERIVVYTALAGSGRDHLVDPIPAPAVDYVCFTDQPLTSQVWQIRPFTWTHKEAVRTAKHPKILPHKYFPDHDLSVWVDANITPGPEIARIAQHYLKAHDLALHKHPHRSCLYREAAVVCRAKKDFPEVINKAILRYYQAGMPHDFGLCECGILFRRHNAPVVIELMDLWWAEISRGTNSDQMPFAFAWWQTRFNPKILDGNLRESPFFAYRPHPPIFWGEGKRLTVKDREYHHLQQATAL